MTTNRVSMPFPSVPPNLLQGYKGTAVLNGISAVPISCPGITATSIVLTSIMLVSGIVGVITVTGITPGVGFSVLSVALAASTIGWEVLEP